jgi:hypothetical protein
MVAAAGSSGTKRKALKKVACVAQPDTIPAVPAVIAASLMVPDAVRILADPGFQRWWRNWWSLPERTRGGVTTASLARWPTWGDQISDQTVGHILRRNNIAPAPKRSQTTTWKEFILIRRHLNVLAGTDFFTVEVLTWRGLVTYYVLLFLHLETRRVSLAGITRHPSEEWMTQRARNAVDEDSGYLRRPGYVLHDGDTKFCAEFRKTLASGRVKCLRLPPRSPNLNAFAERWVRSVKKQMSTHFILFGKGSLRRALKDSANIITARGITKVRRTSCCFLGRLHRSGSRESFDARNAWVVCSSTITGRRLEVAQ